MPKLNNRNSNEKIIGENIRRIRLLRGLSQEKLANALGLTFQQVQKYEKGTNGARGSRIVQIAAALQCPIPSLFEGIQMKDGATIDDPVRVLGETGLGVRFAREWPALTPGMKTCIVELAEHANRIGR